MPGPEVFLSFCAAQTERVHLGSAIFNITPKVNKPVRVAENVALLDHLTGNRFEFGTGRGSSTTEVYGFDIADIDETKAMWREAIPEIPKMWKDGDYSYEGNYFRMPEREVFPKPYGPSHPAMWVAAGRPRPSPRRARWASARSASPWAARPRSPRWSPTTRTPSPTPRRSATTSTTTSWASPTCSAWRTARRPSRRPPTCGMNYYTSLADALARQHPEAQGPPRVAGPDPRARPPSRSRRSPTAGFVIVGDPDDCARAIQRWVDIGVDQLTFSPTTNTLPTEVVVASMELFGREVIPQFDKDPVHSTTRYREQRRASRLATSDDVSDSGDGGPVPQSFNFADLWEAVCAAGRRARRRWCAATQRRTYAELAARANRLAHHLARRASARATTSGSACRTGSSTSRRCSPRSRSGPSRST